MANPEHLERLKEGVDAWNAWRKSNPSVEVNLSGANLNSANLRSANLRSVHLNGADLSGANLRSANLFQANLRIANLNCANLNGANLSGANLSGTKLTEADLNGTDLVDAILFDADLNQTDLIGANLSDADLTGATMREVQLFTAILQNADMNGADLRDAYLMNTTFANNDLSQTKGLETIVHQGPSTIGLDTIYKSGGQIPKEFLLGCGVDETFIDYMNSLVFQPIQFYSCFISYNHQNEDFAKRLHARMREAGLRVWFAPEDIKGGQKIHEQIERAIQMHDRLLLVLSESSIASEWVQTEIFNARQREVKENRRVLFPIRLAPFETLREWKAFDADTGRDMAREIREYFIPDFSNWKDHDAFEAAFARLHKDLKAENTT